MRRKAFLILMILFAAEVSAAAGPPALEHVSSWDDYYIGRRIPGLIASHWRGERYVGQSPIVNLSRVHDDVSQVQDVMGRFNRGELDDFVIQLPSPLTVPYVIVDLNADGHPDLLMDDGKDRATLLWSKEKKAWERSMLPTTLGAIGGRLAHIRKDGAPSLLIRSIAQTGGWHFIDGRWQPDASLVRGMEIDGMRVLTSAGGGDRGVRLIDLDGDGRDEMVVANLSQQAVLQWSEAAQSWQLSSMHWPKGRSIVGEDGGDGGIRFADVNRDGLADLLASDTDGSAVYLFEPEGVGFKAALIEAKRDSDSGALFPSFTDNGRSAGAWLDSDSVNVLSRGDGLNDGPKRAWNRTMRFAMAFSDVVPGFRELVHSDGGKDVWWNYNGQKSPNHFIRQQTKGSRLSWKTTTVSERNDAEKVTFLFVGAMGYQSEPNAMTPRRSPFSLLGRWVTNRNPRRRDLF